jgi:hypothetical protein
MFDDLNVIIGLRLGVLKNSRKISSASSSRSRVRRWAKSEQVENCHEFIETLVCKLQDEGGFFLCLAESEQVEGREEMIPSCLHAAQSFAGSS